MGLAQSVCSCREQNEKVLDVVGEEPLNHLFDDSNDIISLYPENTESDTNSVLPSKTTTDGGIGVIPTGRTLSDRETSVPQTSTIDESVSSSMHVESAPLDGARSTHHTTSTSHGKVPPLDLQKLRQPDPHPRDYSMDAEMSDEQSESSRSTHNCEAVVKVRADRQINPQQKMKYAQRIVSPVTIHIYDLAGYSVKHANKFLKVMGTGEYHTAVEVYDLEWGYGFNDAHKGCTGIFSMEPGQNEVHHSRENHYMGETLLSEEQFNDLIATMREEWLGEEYNLISHNCCHFSKALCERLGTGELPTWLMRLTATGDKPQGVSRISGEVRATASETRSPVKALLKDQVAKKFERFKSLTSVASRRLSTS